MHSFMDRNLTTPPPLILASASRSRSLLLDQIGMSHSQRPVRIDEDAIRDALVQEGATPRDIADTLAEFKARKVDHPGLTLGCDQILALKSEVFAKPRDRHDAAQQLSRLSGHTHHLYSAAVIYEAGEPVWRHVGVARMTMHQLTAAEIDSYLDKTWPDVASSVGAYHAEGYGARLFSRIEGDWFSVLGLPLLEISSYLRLRGWR
jgi:septum formation protein